MKKIIYFLVLVIPFLTFSQKTENEKEFFKQKDKLFLGYIAAGFNATQIDGDRYAGFNNLGANFGVGAFVTYTEKFSNSLEITYSMRGARSSFNHKPSHPRFISFQMDYIEVPLLFNYHDFKVAIFHLGFSYSNVIRTKFLVKDKASILIPHYKWNIDMVVGFTFLIKKHWGINFKYNYSILNNLIRHDINGNKLARKTFFSQSQGSKASSSSNGVLNWYHNVLSFRAMYIF